MSTDNKQFQWTDSAALQFIGFYMAKRDNPDFNDTELVSDFKTRIMENASQSKQVKGGRDWEIVSLKHNGSGNILESTIIPQILESKDYRNSPIYSIHSVKRLSDGEVFNIGDEIFDCSYKKQTINKFHLDKNYGGIKVDCSNNTHVCYLSLSSIHKTDADKELYLAKELLYEKGYILSHPTEGTSAKFKAPEVKEPLFPVELTKDQIDKLTKILSE